MIIISILIDLKKIPSLMNIVSE